jgi:gephyrin
VFVFLIVSDTAAVDATKDVSGPLLHTILTTPPTTSSANATSQYKVAKTIIVPDDPNQIKSVVCDWIEHDALNLLLLTGGTGFAERDVTPDTIGPLLTRQTPGLTHLMLATSLLKTPFAALSRPVSGFIGKTLVLTLPGSPKACRENMDALLPILPHALQLVSGHLQQVVDTHRQLAASGESTGSEGAHTHHHQEQPQHQHTCLHHHSHHHHQHDSQQPRALNLNTPGKRCPCH